jgi:hypothetical protein
MSRQSERALNGYIKLGVIESVNEDTFRCEVRMLESSSCEQAILNPSPLFSSMPSPGTLCLVYEKSNYYRRILLPLSEIQNESSRTIEERLDREEEPGLTPVMKVNEMFVGRNGRILFDDAGNVLAASERTRAQLKLMDEDALVEMFSYDFDIYTTAKGIRIRTEASDPDSFGDTLFIERNTPAPEGTIPTNITRLKIGPQGEYELGVADDTARVNISENGLMDFANNFGSFQIGIEGTVEIIGKNVGIRTNAVGDITLDTESGTLGSIFLKSKFGVDVAALFSANITAPAIGLNGATFFGGPISFGSAPPVPATPQDGISPPAPVVPSNPLASEVIAETGKPLSLRSDSEIALETAIVKLGESATKHVATSELVLQFLTVIRAFQQLVQLHVHPGVFPGPSVTGISPTLAVAPVIPIPTLANLGSLSVTVRD